MSAASLSKSYAALLGVGGYMKGKSAWEEAKAGLGRVLASERKEGGGEGGDGEVGGAEKSGFGAKMIEKLKTGEAKA